MYQIQGNFRSLSVNIGTKTLESDETPSEKSQNLKFLNVQTL